MIDPEDVEAAAVLLALGGTPEHRHLPEGGLYRLRWSANDPATLVLNLEHRWSMAGWGWYPSCFKVTKHNEVAYWPHERVHPTEVIEWARAVAERVLLSRARATP